MFSIDDVHDHAALKNPSQSLSVARLRKVLYLQHLGQTTLDLIRSSQLLSIPERWLLSQSTLTAKVPKLPPAAPSPRATGADREPVAGGIAGEAVAATPLVADIYRANFYGSEWMGTKS